MSYPASNTWTPQAVNQLKNYVRQGLNNSAIARHMKIKSNRVADKRSALGLVKTKQKYQPRDCLVCGNEFQSEGNHNRLCGKCRHKDYSPWR